MPCLLFNSAVVLSFNRFFSEVLAVCAESKNLDKETVHRAQLCSPSRCYRSMFRRRPEELRPWQGIISTLCVWDIASTGRECRDLMGGCAVIRARAKAKRRRRCLARSGDHGCVVLGVLQSGFLLTSVQEPGVPAESYSSKAHGEIRKVFLAL